MKVDAALLEKYHLNQCSADERLLVEDWLLNDDADELEFHSSNDKVLVKDAIWSEIETLFPDENRSSLLAQKNEPVFHLKKSATFYMWKGAVAASVFFGLIGLGFYFMLPMAKPVEFVAFNNPSALHVNHFNSSAYNLAIGTETFAKINKENGGIDLTGSILISAKQDISLNFNGARQVISLKKGQSYIILNTKSGTHGFIAINERNLINLPPVMQKKLIREFDI